MRRTTAAPPLTRLCLRAEAAAILYSKRLPQKPPRNGGGFLNKGDLEALLTPAERAMLRAFPSEKRRLDWLSGRIAAKRALGELLGRPELELELANEPSGRPACLAARDLFFSISHCALGGVCAASASGPVGVDWETVRPLAAGVLELVSDASERAGIVAPEDGTRLWTRKEAVLKLLGLGLGCDPRGARVFPEVSFRGAALERWRLLGSPEIAFSEDLRDGAVLTTAFARPRPMARKCRLESPSRGGR